MFWRKFKILNTNCLILCYLVFTQHSVTFSALSLDIITSFNISFWMTEVAHFTDLVIICQLSFEPLKCQNSKMGSSGIISVQFKNSSVIWSLDNHVYLFLSPESDIRGTFKSKAPLRVQFSPALGGRGWERVKAKTSPRLY